MSWSVTAIILFLLGNLFPIVAVDQLGFHRELTLISVQDGLALSGMQTIAWLVASFTLGFPAILLFSMVLINVATNETRTSKIKKLAISVFKRTRQWAMPEVMLLAVVVSIFKLQDLAWTSIQPAFGFLMAGIFAMILAIRYTESETGTNSGVQRKQTPEFRSNQPSIALMAAATILLIPANLLPIMELRISGVISHQTILGGVKLLIHNDLWIIAMIVFIASIVVPFAKLASLLWLVSNARNTRKSRVKLKLHQLLDFIGRWSMLDVFIVAILAGLIRFGQIAEIQPGPALPLFTAAVILTTLAVHRFDTRRLWSPL